MRIGELAKAAGVGVETLRYYERRGLLAEPARRQSGYRAYEPEAVDVVRFIKRAQQLGFSLKEIQELLALRSGQGTCRDVRERAQTKLEDIDEKLRQLEAMKSALEQLVHQCAGRRRSTRYCPIIEAMEDAGAG